MRLSEAILLGDSLRRRDHTLYLRTTADPICGCGLGGAWLAVGRTAEEWAEQTVSRLLRGEFWDISDDLLRLEWPWLTKAIIRRIGHQFAEVCKGHQTLEQLADYVHSIEPAEPGEAVQESVAFMKREQAMVMAGEGPTALTERAELLKVKAEELETMPR